MDNQALKCELKIVRAKNLELVSDGDVFIRYYLYTGSGKRIRLNTRQIPSTDEPYWNEGVTLECHSSTNTIEELKQQSVVFELRWRSVAPVFSRIAGSKLLGRAEIAWKDVLGSADASMEKWTTLATKSGALLGLKQPALQVGLKVGGVHELGHVDLNTTKKASRPSMKWDGCGCQHGSCNGRDEDIFAMAAALTVCL